MKKRALVHYPGGSSSQSLGLCGATWKPQRGYHTGGDLEGITCASCRAILLRCYGVRSFKPVRFKAGAKVFSQSMQRTGRIEHEGRVQRVYYVTVRGAKLLVPLPVGDLLPEEQ